MTVTHKISMDLTRRGVIPRIDAVQADKYCRTVEIALYSGGLEWSPPSDASIVVRYSRPDGACGNYDMLPSGAAAGTIDGSTIAVQLAPQVLTVPGIAHLAVGVTDGAVEINTFYLEIRVQENPAGIDPTVEDYNGRTSSVVTIEEACESFDIDTGLTTIDSVIVVRSTMPSDANGTWGWLQSNAGAMTNYFSYGSSVSWRYGIKSSKIADNGDGTVTVSQYTSTYPILPGEYNWIAYGNK